MGVIAGTLVSDDGEPLPEGLTIKVFFRDQNTGQRYVTTEEPGFGGSFRIIYPDELVPHKWAVSQSHYWQNSGDLRDDTSEFEVKLERIPRTSRSPHFGWWHDALGIRRYSRTLGSGITVGVIDSGCCTDHSNLRHVKHVGCMAHGKIQEEIPPYNGHGTHVCGIIGARPGPHSEPTELAGIAPGVDLLSLQLNFEPPTPLSDSISNGFEPHHRTVWNFADVADAIDFLVDEKGADLINLSLALAVGNEAPPNGGIDKAIRRAAQKGTLCVAAAGNDGHHQLAFPAAHGSVVSVASVGKKNSGPSWARSLHLPEFPSHIAGDYYLGSRSNHGEGLSCCAPGVGIVSTIPVSDGHDLQPYVDMTGTSMAAPMVIGALAVRLSAPGSRYSRLTGFDRYEFARDLIPTICRDLGLTRNLQGHGMILAS